MVQQIVLPIKDSNILKMVQDTLLDSFRAGRRNYTIFQVGKATLLRVSDVMKLKTPLAISLPGWYGIGTILVLLTITTMIYTAERKRLPFLIIVYIFIVIDSLLGIGTRIPGLSVFLNQPIPKSTALWVLVIGVPIVALICGFGSWWYLKKHEN